MRAPTIPRLFNLQSRIPVSTLPKALLKSKQTTLTFSPFFNALNTGCAYTGPTEMHKIFPVESNVASDSPFPCDASLSVPLSFQKSSSRRRPIQLVDSKIRLLL